MTKVEAWIEIIEGEDSVGIEETADLGMELDPCLGIKIKIEGVTTVEKVSLL